LQKHFRLQQLIDTQNKPLSDDPDPVLALQGIGWLVRKAISMMSVQLDIKSYQDSDGLWHIDVEQPGAAGIKGTTELRTIDGKPADHEDHIFGHVVGTTTWGKVGDFKDDGGDESYLKADWLDDEILVNKVEATNGWTATQIWGFQNVNVGGVTERRYARNIIVKKKDKQVKARLIYDYSPAK